jgi:pimeloyl-ACP methyl ester carboxylesterase
MNGCSELLTTRLVKRLEERAADTGERLTLIGHSRGGQLAKVVATRRPDLVESVVTLGSPLTDQWASHLALKIVIATISELARRGIPIGGCGADRCPFGSCSHAYTRDLVGPAPADVDLTSVYSRTDGVVQWRSCLHPSARRVEVRAAHVQMAVHPDVIRTVVAALER